MTTLPTLPSELLALVCSATSASGAHVEQRVQELWDGYGEILRVRLSGSALASVVVKWVHPPEAPRGAAALRSHVRKLESYQVERAFYTSFAQRCDDACRVPQAITCTRREQGWLFVLEDLHLAGFTLRPRRPSEGELARCLGWLAAFHATFLATPPEGLWQQGTYWHLATRPDELARMDHPRLCAAAPELDRALRTCRFRTLVHGDAKLDNFCFRPDGAVAALDFQYVGAGVGVQDVCYFLSSCFSQERCARDAPRHLDAYFAALRSELARRQPGVSADELEAEWRALFPAAWADFYRFLLGWSPELARAESYGRALAERWLAATTGAD